MQNLGSSSSQKSRLSNTYFTETALSASPFDTAGSVLPGWPITHLIFTLQVKGFCSSPSRADPWQPLVILLPWKNSEFLPRLRPPSSFALRDQKGIRSIQTKAWHYSINQKEPEWSLMTSFVPWLRLHRAQCSAEMSCQASASFTGAVLPCWTPWIMHVFHPCPRTPPSASSAKFHLLSSSN